MASIGLVGGRVSGPRWRWHSKRARLIHRLAIRLGLLTPPVVRVSPFVEHIWLELERAKPDFERALFLGARVR